MSTQIENNELRTRFNTIWANRTPVKWPNVTFTPPTPPGEYVRFSVVEGDTYQTTFGSDLNNHRTVGILYISIYTPSNTGDALALQRADEAAAVFRNWAGTNIKCRSPKIKVIGETSEGYQINVSVPFQRDELL